MRYALALHDLGPSAHRSDEIVAALARPSSELSSIRSAAVEEGRDCRAVSLRLRVSASAHVELHRPYRRAMQKAAALATRP